MKNIINKLTLLINLMFVTLFTQNAMACTVCFKGDAAQPANQGLRMAIIVMLFVLSIIMILFTKFFMGFSKRSKLLNEAN